MRTNEEMILTRLTELGELSINFEDGYYYIEVKGQKYSTPVFTQEALFNALVCIQAGIAVKEKWYS